MNPLLRQHAKIGILHFMIFPEVGGGEGPVVETLTHLLEDEYFDAIEVTKVKDPGVAREVASLLKASHMTVGFGAQPVQLGGKLNLNSLDHTERKKAVEAVRACFDQAVSFGAEALSVLSGPWARGKEAETEAVLVESLVELSREAATAGLDFTLEIFDDEVDKKSYVGKWPVALRVGEAVRKECPNFGLLHDLSHLAVLGEKAQDALPPIRHLLVHSHIGNAVVSDKSHPAYGDNHPRFGVESGENDVEEVADFLKVLFEIGYLGGAERNGVAFEIKPMKGENSHLVIANAKRTLNEASYRLR